MRVDAFDYALPPDLIAQSPTEDREAARLLVVPQRGNVEHREIATLADRVAPGTLVVVNDTLVLPARILGTKEGTGGKAEVFLVKKLQELHDTHGTLVAERWTALARASKSLRPGTRIVKGELLVEFEGKGEGDLFEVRLSARGDSPVDQARTTAGQIPLPPYIRRPVEADDSTRYQTVFARVAGAVAAPTAGLHLTNALLDRLRARDCEIETCTLHVGLGTFQPVTVSDFDDHTMHAEHFEVSERLTAAVARCRARKGSVLAIGTTVVRALESAKDPTRIGHITPRAEETRMLIQPGYRFSVVDRLLTNFHLPKSTLLALVSAFAGADRIRAAYLEAVQNRYRFFSYGDAMLLDREDT